MATVFESPRHPGAAAAPRKLGRGLVVGSAVIALALAVPVLSVFVLALRPDVQGVTAHIAATLLTDYAVNSLMLVAGVGVGTLLLGTGAAWIVAMHRFPGRRHLEWALLLPLAMPTYVVAYVYADRLQFAGPVQSALRRAFGWERGDYWFPDLHSTLGAAILFSLVLYPYVYLLARAAFLERAAGMMEAARSLGYSPLQSFLRVALPMARPAIAGGVALAIMETLAEFGAVSYLGVPTFTTGIYRAWYSFGDPVAAAQLSSMLLAFVAFGLVLERLSRGRARFHDTTSRRREPPLLAGAGVFWAWVGCLIPLAGGFLVPAALLLDMALSQGDAQFGGKYLELARNSVTLAATTSLLAAGIALLLGYAQRSTPGLFMRAVHRVAALGYATPGTVIAVGALIPLTALDNAVDAWMRARFGVSTGLLLTGGIVVLLFAYLVRFLAVALNSVEAALARIRPGMDEAARSLGCGGWCTLRRVHIPLLRSGLFSAILLVFVDVMKELPATVVLRPFNFETLATQVFILTADERLAEAATPALAIVAVGLLPVLLLSRAIYRGRATGSAAL